MAEKFVNKKAHRDRANDYTLSELDAFVNATYKSYLSIIASKPDALIAPLRGAEPLVKVMNLYASLEKKTNLMPRVYYPKIGQISIGQNGKVIDKTLPGFLQSQKESEQLKELNRMVDRLLVNAKNSNKKRLNVVFVDEVRHGGSVSQAVEMVEKILANRVTKIPINISVIAIAEKKAYRSVAYNNLKSRFKVKEFLVPRVFTMDSGNSLFPLLVNKSSVWPFKPRLRLGITKKAIRGRSQLLDEILAIRTIKSNNLVSDYLGKSKAMASIKRIPTR
jgi:hypothetical protein